MLQCKVDLLTVRCQHYALAASWQNAAEHVCRHLYSKLGAAFAAAWLQQAHLTHCVILETPACATSG